MLDDEKRNDGVCSEESLVTSKSRPAPRLKVPKACTLRESFEAITSHRSLCFPDADRKQSATELGSTSTSPGASSASSSSGSESQRSQASSNTDERPRRKKATEVECVLATRNVRPSVVARGGGDAAAFAKAVAVARTGEGIPSKICLRARQIDAFALDGDDSDDSPQAGSDAFALDGDDSDDSPQAGSDAFALDGDDSDDSPQAGSDAFALDGDDSDDSPQAGSEQTHSPCIEAQYDAIEAMAAATSLRARTPKTARKHLATWWLQSLRGPGSDFLTKKSDVCVSMEEVQHEFGKTDDDAHERLSILTQEREESLTRGSFDDVFCEEESCGQASDVIKEESCGQASDVIKEEIVRSVEWLDKRELVDENRVLLPELLTIQCASYQSGSSDNLESGYSLERLQANPPCVEVMVDAEGEVVDLEKSDYVRGREVGMEYLRSEFGTERINGVEDACLCAQNVVERCRGKQVSGASMDEEEAIASVSAKWRTTMARHMQEQTQEKACCQVESLLVAVTEQASDYAANLENVHYELHEEASGEIEVLGSLAITRARVSQDQIEDLCVELKSKRGSVCQDQHLHKEACGGIESLAIARAQVNQKHIEDLSVELGAEPKEDDVRQARAQVSQKQIEDLCAEFDAERVSMGQLSLELATAQEQISKVSAKASQKEFDHRIVGFGEGIMERTVVHKCETEIRPTEEFAKKVLPDGVWHGHCHTASFAVPNDDDTEIESLNEKTGIWHAELIVSNADAATAMEDLDVRVGRWPTELAASEADAVARKEVAELRTQFPHRVQEEFTAASGEHLSCLGEASMNMTDENERLHRLHVFFCGFVCTCVGWLAVRM